MEYKSAKDMTLKDPSNYRHGGRWRGHLRGEKTGRMMWMRRGKPVKRSETYGDAQLIGLELEVARKEIEEQTSVDDITGGHQSSFALVEQAVRLFGKNPDHYNNVSYDEVTSGGTRNDKKEHNRGK